MSNIRLIFLAVCFLIHSSSCQIHVIKFGNFDDETTTRNQQRNQPSPPSITGLRITIGYLQKQGYDPQTTSNINLAGKNVNQIDDNVFGRYTNLRDLNLNANAIDRVTNKTFENNNRLQNLTLYQNRLSDLGANTFVTCVRLRLLNLGKNQINYIEPGSFNGLRNLELLDLEGNQLDHLDSDMFKGLYRIK